MATFISSLPDDLLKSLASIAKELQVPKNKIIEKALKSYLEQIDKAKYARSFKRAAGDHDLLSIAKEGMS